jgi:hypothetical protein
LATDVFFNVETINKKVYFSLYGFDNKFSVYREVCYIEIPYKDRLDKRAIYIAIADLIKMFDFSFRVTFETIENIYNFTGGTSHNRR